VDSRQDDQGAVQPGPEVAGRRFDHDRRIGREGRSTPPPLGQFEVEFAVHGNELQAVVIIAGRRADVVNPAGISMKSPARRTVAVSRDSPSTQ
jgi:hypothetical protein